MRVKIKVCCIASAAEAAAAVRLGVHAVGLVSAMPSGPGVIDEAEIAGIARTVPPAVGSFLLTSATEAATIVQQQRRCAVNTVQLVDRVTADVHRELRAALPGVALVQVVHVTGPESVDEACDVAPRVDAVLLDSGNPDLERKELGGTGRTHDWALSRRIREAIERPLFLAGGLTPDNVAAAIAAVRPFGVDVCSGVRVDGDLDPERLAAFVAAVAT